jgi:uncharacterized protein
MQTPPLAQAELTRELRLEYFFYGRDQPGVAELRRETMEAHWSFMDGYAEAMIARGPTLSDEDETVMTGSVHLVDLPDAAAAQVFAFQEPFFKSGVFGEVMVRRWSNTLGRTMWDFAGSDGQRFLVIGHGAPEETERRNQLSAEQREYFLAGPHGDGLIALGPLLSDSGDQWRGTAILVEARDREAVEALMRDSPYAKANLYTEVEIHRWRFGGRPAGQGS